MSKIRKILSGMLTAALVLTAVSLLHTEQAYAASGNVYTCTVNRLYQHPVTGIVEDSGGAESYDIGQGMVEGCVYPDGILEVTDSGSYYLTIRMSLMDYTSGHTFWVQTWGEDGWATPAAGITGTGTDSNGTTADICIQVPNENCIVRGAMYVEPMGRDVYWYMYPSNFSAGNNTNMNAIMVTSPSGSDQAQQEAAQGGQSQQNAEQSQQNAEQTQQSGGTGTQSTGNSQSQTRPSSGALSGGSSLSSGNTGLSGSSESGSSASTVKPSALQSSANPANGGENADSGNASETTGENTLTGLNSTIGEPAAPVSSETADPDTQSSVGKAQGLSLSTKGTEASAEPAAAASAGIAGPANQILSNTLSVLIPGGILIAVAAIIVYAFRKNWKRWGGAQDDE